MFIDAVHLKDMLGCIQPDPDNRHRTAPLGYRCKQPQSGTADAVGGRPPQHGKGRDAPATGRRRFASTRPMWGRRSPGRPARECETIASLFSGGRWRCLLSGSIRFGGSIVRLTGFLGPRLRSQLAYLGADRLERSEFMLLWAKLVGIGAVWSVDRLLKPHRKILVEVCHFRALLSYDVGGDIVGLLLGEHRGTKCRADRHVVHGISGSGQKPAHSGAVIEAVRAPKGAETISRPGRGVLSEPVRTVAGCGSLGKNLGAMTAIGGARRLFDLQGASTHERGTVGDSGRQPSDIGRKRPHLATVER